MYAIPSELMLCDRKRQNQMIWNRQFNAVAPSNPPHQIFSEGEPLLVEGEEKLIRRSDQRIPYCSNSGVEHYRLKNGSVPDDSSAECAIS